MRAKIVLILCKDGELLTFLITSIKLLQEKFKKSF